MLKSIPASRRRASGPASPVPMDPYLEGGALGTCLGGIVAAGSDRVERPPAAVFCPLAALALPARPLGRRARRGQRAGGDSSATLTICLQPGADHGIEAAGARVILPGPQSGTIAAIFRKGYAAMGLVLQLRQWILRIMGPLAFLPPLLGRISVGYVFAISGWGKLGNLEMVTKYFDSLGIPFASLQAPFVATVELVCGVLLMIGLATRFSSFMLISTMVVALATAIWPDMESWTELPDKIEWLYLVIMSYTLVFGAGPISLDYLVVRMLGGDSEPDADSVPGAGRRLA
jgi:putative oxidoreductase